MFEILYKNNSLEFGDIESIAEWITPKVRHFLMTRRQQLGAGIPFSIPATLFLQGLFRLPYRPGAGRMAGRAATITHTFCPIPLFKPKAYVILEDSLGSLVSIMCAASQCGHMMNLLFAFLYQVNWHIGMVAESSQL